MNELHISLAIAGVLVVICVYAFNRYQERKFRRQSERDFGGGEQDVLLDSAGDETQSDERREPSMETGAHEAAPNEMIPPTASDAAAPRSEEKTVAAKSSNKAQAAQTLDEIVDYVAEIYPKETNATAVLLEFEKNFAGFSRPVRLFGLSARTGALEPVMAGSHTYDKLLIALQLVYRSGALAASELDDFCLRAKSLADALASLAELPDRAEALERATMLDEFCATVDMLIGMNVVFANGETIPATKIRALVEASGMKLREDGAFHYMNDDGLSLFALSNFEKPAFSADNIRHLSTHGVTLLLDVPVVANGARVFERMLGLARQIADSLGGAVVDDNRRPLSEVGIAKIKQQLTTISAKMDAASIPVGGERALRLFS
ncbi:MAG: cell division protein ZipA C-terminal FtsZ-binding domain-containing protein [Sulfuricellaceae bacterium]